MCSRVCLLNWWSAGTTAIVILAKLIVRQAEEKRLSFSKNIDLCSSSWAQCLGSRVDVSTVSIIRRYHCFLSSLEAALPVGSDRSGIPVMWSWQEAFAGAI